MTNKDLKERINQILSLVNKHKDTFKVRDFSKKDLEIWDYKNNLLFEVKYNEFISSTNYYSIQFFLNKKWFELRLDDTGKKLNKFGKFDLLHLDIFYRSLFYKIADFEIDDLEPDPSDHAKAGLNMFFDYLDGNDNAFIQPTVEKMAQDMIDKAVNDPDLGLVIDCKRGIYEVYDRESSDQIMKYRKNWDGAYSMQFWADDEYTIKDDYCCKVCFLENTPLVPIPFKEFEEAYHNILL